MIGQSSLACSSYKNLIEIIESKLSKYTVIEIVENQNQSSYQLLQNCLVTAV